MAKPLPNQGMRCIICGGLIEGLQRHDRILCDNMECDYNWKRLKEGLPYGKYKTPNLISHKEIFKRINKKIMTKKAKQERDERRYNRQLKAECYELICEYGDWKIETRQFI